MILRLAFLVIGFLFFFSSSYAIDEPPGGVVSVGSTGQYTQSSSDSASAQGGNTTAINFSGNATTTKWQGFYGNISGSLALGTGSEIFYDFGEIPATTVLATTSANFAFVGMESGDPSLVDSAWNFNTALEIDQASDIFTTSTGSYAGINFVPETVIGNGFGSGIGSEFAAGAVKDHQIFMGNVTTDGLIGFDGNRYQFQFLVPVESGTEVYNLYLSIE